MKPPLILVVSCGLLIAATAHAADQPKHLDPSAPRTITVSESEAPPLIRAGLLQSTLILLPNEEKVTTVFGGDIINWIVDGGHVASRFVSVKPKVVNAATDIHIISDHGNDYTLQLREVSGEGDTHYDSKMFIEPGDKASKDRLASLPVFVPAADLEKAKADAAAAEKAKAAELKLEADKAEQYRSQYPGRLHFDYVWDEKKGRELGLEQVWHDDKFTYLRGHFQETLALYEVKDKKPSLINFDFSDGLYTVPKQLDNGYLAIGKKKVEFHRVEGKE